MNMTAQEVLDMTWRDALSLFPGDERQKRKGFASLLSKWHPDACADPRAANAFAHIVNMRDLALGRKRKTQDNRILKTADGRKLRISPLNTLSCDQGEIIVNQNTLATIFPAKCPELGHREAEVIRGFRFADDKMKIQMEPFLPRLMKLEELENGDLLLIVQKGPGEILLSDLLASEGRMPDVHAAWLCSGLMNICTWLEHCGLVHGAISPENILIDPETHAVRLAAGWAFATRVHERPIALPGRTLDLVPRLGLKNEPIDTDCDRELVRQTVRESLGDPTGTGGTVFALPAAVSTWITCSPTIAAVDDYALWHTALEKGWGRRRFVDYPVRVTDVYRAV